MPHAQQILQITLGDEKQHSTNDGAVHGAHAAYDHNQQHVHHDFKRQRGVRPVVAQPKCQHRTGHAGKQSRKNAGRGAVHHHAVANRFGTKFVFANGLQHAAKR
jgi:hypothetical protein